MIIDLLSYTGEPITRKQHNLIKKMEYMLGIHFIGNNFADAYNFIDDHYFEYVMSCHSIKPRSNKVKNKKSTYMSDADCSTWGLDTSMYY